ncbi:hypothetical protein LVY75_00215 (plasmid) [Sinorhizobium sp. B11]
MAAACPGQAGGHEGNILNPVPDAKDYEQALQPIAPGTYVVTYACCELFDGNVTVELEAGGDYDGLFSYIGALDGAAPSVKARSPMPAISG